MSPGPDRFKQRLFPCSPCAAPALRRPRPRRRRPGKNIDCRSGARVVATECNASLIFELFCQLLCAALRRPLPRPHRHRPGGTQSSLTFCHPAIHGKAATASLLSHTLVHLDRSPTSPPPSPMPPPPRCDGKLGAAVHAVHGMLQELHASKEASEIPGRLLRCCFCSPSPPPPSPSPPPRAPLLPPPR